MPIKYEKYQTNRFNLIQTPMLKTKHLHEKNRAFPNQSCSVMFCSNAVKSYCFNLKRCLFIASFFLFTLPLSGNNISSEYADEICELIINCPPAAVMITCETDTTDLFTAIGGSLDTIGCTGVTVTHDYVAPNACTGGTVEVTFTITGLEGTLPPVEQTCVTVITLEGVPPPTIICQPDANVECEDDIPNVQPATFSTTCGPGELIISRPEINGIPGCNGTTYTYVQTISDICGQSASCSQVFTIVNDPPLIDCPADMTVTCVTDIAPSLVEFTTSCSYGGVASVVGPVISGDPDCSGTTFTYTHIVTDECGESSSCVQVFTIENDAPIISCPADQTVTCEADIQVVAATFTTSCGLTGVTAVAGAPIIIGEPNCAGTTYNYTHIATDICGRTATCIQVFTIQNAAPTISCPPDVTVTCAADISPVSADFTTSCGSSGNVEISEPVIVGDADCNGATYTYTHTVTDACGRTASCDQVFTIQNSPPTIISCPPGATVTCAADINVELVDFTASCGGSASVVGPSLQGEPDCSGTIYTYTHIVVDNCGQAVFCDQVFVIDNAPPTISCPAGAVVTCAADIAPGEAEFTYSCTTNVIGTGDSIAVEVTGPVISGEADCDAATYTYTYSITDACGRTASCDQVFTIINNPPEITSCPADQTVTCAEDIDVIPAEFTADCGGIINVIGPILNGEPGCGGTTYTYTHTVIDNCGRTVSCDQIFTIDNAPPTISCLPGGVVSCEGDIILDDNPAFTYSCTTGIIGTGGEEIEPVITGPVIDGGADCDGATYTYTYSITDNCGRTASCDQVFTVQNDPPVITFCPPDEITTCEADIAFTAAEFTASCGVFYSLTGPVVVGEPDCPGTTYTFTHEVMDNCGRMVSCEQTYTIQNDAPTITCPPGDTVACVTDIILGDAEYTYSCQVEMTEPIDEVVITGPVVSGGAGCNGSTYTFTYTITDPCGRSASCEQMFFINDPADVCFCDCGIIGDSDGDEVCDDQDICPLGDDNIDTDGDGIPDACDCDELGDADGDFICDDEDICPLGDDLIDTDGDGIPDACDCDELGDADGDFVCDDEDICPLGDDLIDTDGDGIPDACDCDGLDADGDFVCDDEDICPDGDDLVDSDGDGIPDDCECEESDLDFENNSSLNWTTNATSGTYTVGDQTIDVQIADPDNIFVDSYESGSGFAVGIDPYDTDDAVMITYTLSEISSDVVFDIVDLDYKTGGSQQQEGVCVYGLLGGSPVQIMPVITSLDGNVSINGNCAEATTNSSTSGQDESILVTFDQCIDQIVIVYGSGTNSPTAYPSYSKIHIGADFGFVTAVCENECNEDCEDYNLDFENDSSLSWTTNATSGSYTVGDQTIDINIADSDNIFINSEESGAGIMVGIDPYDTNDAVTITYTLSETSSNVVFDIVDLDRKYYANGSQQQEGVCIYGLLNGSSTQIMPVITSLDGSVEINGNCAAATTNSATSGQDESILVAFNECIDEIVIVYGSGPDSPTPAPTYSKIYIGGEFGFNTQVCDNECNDGCTDYSLDFDNNTSLTWADNATSGTYTVDDQTIDIDILDADNIFVDSKEWASGIMVGIDPSDVNDNLVITYSLSQVSNDVVFDIVDLDRKYSSGGSKQQEAVCVYGLLGGSLVQIMPVITSLDGSVAISGNCAEATTNSATSGADESILVTFDECIDQVVIIYGTGNNSPTTDPTYSKIYIGKDFGFNTEVCEGACPIAVDCASIGDDDGDGVCNDADVCPNGDDNIDDNNNGTPDACESICEDATLDFAVSGYYWANNTTSGNYTVGSQSYSISIADPDDILEYTGEDDSGIKVGIEPHTVDDNVTITYNLGQASNDVVFDIVDLDYKTGGSQQQEGVCVYGLLGGNSTQIMPVITSLDGSVSIDGNCAEATANSSASGDDESILVTFTECIDQVIIVYGSGNNSPTSDPSYSSITIGEHLGFTSAVCNVPCNGSQRGEGEIDITLMPNLIGSGSNVTVGINQDFEGAAEFMLFDELGRLVYMSDFELGFQTRYDFDPGYLTAGVYFAKVRTDSWYSVTKKLIVINR